MKIRVDNVGADVTDLDLRTLFELFGKVQSVRLNERQNWALVEMSSKSAGKEAIAHLDGQNLKGIDLSVSEMSARPPRRGGRPRRRPRRR